MIKPIPEFPYYFIDDSGTVWTNVCRGPSRCNNPEGNNTPLRKVNPRPSKGSYDRVYMRHISGKRLDKYIHRLVAQAFIPNPENKECVDHIDCNRRNNHVSNLCWISTKENARKTLRINHLVRDEKRKTFIGNYDWKRYSLLPSESLGTKDLGYSNIHGISRMNDAKMAEISVRKSM